MTGGGESLRVYATLRSAQLERLPRMTPARTLYSGTRYDFDESAVTLARPPERRREREVIAELARGGHPVVELNEPAMVGRWPHLLLQVVAARWGALWRRTPTVLVSYAIGNGDPAAQAAARWRLPAPLARFVTRLVMWALVRSLDRLAFGTDGAADAYRRWVGDRVLADRSRVVPALPAPCDCPAEPVADRSHQVLFVGAFADRKGILPLLGAWEEVSRRDPDLRLHLVGTGPRTKEVLDWARGRADVEVTVDPPRAEVHRALRRAGVLVLWSQPASPWREQIGLPILEGLAHGCEVVTTTETGLAAWLDAHDHDVLPPDANAARMAGAIVGAARRHGERGGSVGSLPDEDQRLAADRWLFTGTA